MVKKEVFPKKLLIIIILHTMHQFFKYSQMGESSRDRILRPNCMHLIFASPALGYSTMQLFLLKFRLKKIFYN